MNMHDNYSEWLSKYPWELFISISLGKKHDPNRLRRELNGGLLRRLDRAHRTCSASVGVLADFKERPHIHLLLLSRDRCLSADIVTPLAASIYGSSSVNVQSVYDRSPLVRYVVNHLRHGHEENMIFSNLSLLSRSAEPGRAAA